MAGPAGAFALSEKKEGASEKKDHAFREEGEDWLGLERQGAGYLIDAAESRKRIKGPPVPVVSAPNHPIAQSPQTRSRPRAQIVARHYTYNGRISTATAAPGVASLNTSYFAPTNVPGRPRRSWDVSASHVEVHR